jgi:hypothetical protein
MKLVNTSDLKRLLDDSESENLFDSREEEAGPCRQIRITPEDDTVSLLVDGQEVVSHSLASLGAPRGLPSAFVDKLMRTWREEGVEAACRMLEGGRKR